MRTRGSSNGRCVVLRNTYSSDLDGVMCTWLARSVWRRWGAAAGKVVAGGDDAAERQLGAPQDMQVAAGGQVEDGCQIGLADGKRLNHVVGTRDGDI